MAAFLPTDKVDKRRVLCVHVNVLPPRLCFSQEPWLNGATTGKAWQA